MARKIKDLKELTETVPVKIAEIDRLLRLCSLPMLRAVDRQLAADIKISEELANTALILRRYLAGKITLSSFFWKTNAFKYFILTELEAFITDGYEWPQKRTWKETFFDLLPAQRKSEVLAKLSNKTMAENAQAKRLKALRKYMFNYLHGIAQPVELIKNLSNLKKTAIVLKNAAAIVNPAQWTFTA